MVLQRVLMQAVAHLMGEDGQDLVGGHGRHQGVVEDDGLHLPEAREVRVGLGGPARGIHDLDGPDFIAVLLQKLGNAFLQLPVFERRELVEDPAEEGVQEGDEQQEQGGRCGEGQDQPVAEALVEAHDHGPKAHHQPQLQHELLDLVADKGLALGAVEAVLLLDVHGVVPGEGDERERGQGGEEHHRKHLPPIALGEQASESGVGVGKDQRKINGKACRGGEDAPADLLAPVPPPLQVGVPIIHVPHIGRDGIVPGTQADQIQKQAVQVYNAQNDDGDGFVVHTGISFLQKSVVRPTERL